MISRRKEREEAELARIRDRARADSQAARDALRPGYAWVNSYPGQIIGRSLTCDICGAVVTLQTQEKHTTWHGERA